METQVLIVDDDPEIISFLDKFLSNQGYQVNSSNSAEEALKILSVVDTDIVLTDFKMPGLDGITFTREIKKSQPNAIVILMTGYGDIDTAVHAIKAGAYHFISKPLHLVEVNALLETALENRRIAQENIQLKKEINAKYNFGQLLGKSAKMQQLFNLLERLAISDATVLIEGESGTGKELVARALHFQGRRKGSMFVPVNCAAISESLIESELFGHTKGSYTGAQGKRNGLFIEAANGTIFLDEIGEMPLSLQSKLLRVLEDRKIRPVGSDKEIPVDTRVIAATNRNLETEIENENFRADLYYRLKVVQVKVPPLREHPEDIMLLANSFLDRFSKKANRDNLSFSSSAIKVMENYNWPGNVRELSHVVERSVILSSTPEIQDCDLGLKDGASDSQLVVDKDTGSNNLIDSNLNIDEMTKQLVSLALEKTGYHKTNAAIELGIHPRTLTRMMKRFGMSDSED